MSHLRLVVNDQDDDDDDPEELLHYPSQQRYVARLLLEANARAEREYHLIITGLVCALLGFVAGVAAALF